MSATVGACSVKLHCVSIIFSSAWIDSSNPGNCNRDEQKAVGGERQSVTLKFLNETGVLIVRGLR